MTVADLLAAGLPSVASVELVRLELPLLRPHVYAGGRELARQVVLVRAIAPDSVEGWGECSALSHAGYVNETTDSSWRALRDDVVPAWLAGRAPKTHAAMARAAVEVAAVDIELRRRGVALAPALAESLGAPTHAIEWCAVIGLDATTADVDEAIEAGARQLKFKLAPDRQLGLLIETRRNHPGLSLAADANGSFLSADQVPSALAEIGLTYLEQPLPPGDLSGSALVAQRLDVPVALDESLTSVARLGQAVEMGACSVASVKVARLGGLRETLRLLDTVRRLDVSAFVGGMLESGVGRTVAHAVAAQATCTLPCDAGPTGRYFAVDVTPSITADDRGLLHAATGLGIGASPSPDTIEQFCIERMTLPA